MQFEFFRKQSVLLLKYSQDFWLLLIFINAILSTMAQLSLTYHFMTSNCAQQLLA